jgi:hypothetical protein
VQRPDYAELLASSEACVILNKRNGKLVPLSLNAPQRRIIRAALRCDRVVVGKIRQVGSSTGVAYLMKHLAMRNPGLPMCIVADTQDNANGILAKIKKWLTGIGVKLLVSGVESITLENGATIDALTAISPADDGESRVGRSKSYGFILATEMAFWRSARAVWAALIPPLLGNAIVVVESTGSPGDGLYKEILESTTGWVPLFIGVEDFEEYRADPASIDDITFTRLKRDYGFKRRDSAAWWYAKLRDDFKGDVFRMLREFPVQQPHMFMFQQGQHITSWREVPVRVDGHWNVYVEDRDLDEPVAFGVDTATGVSKDASAIAEVGQRTGRTIRTYRRNDIEIPDFIDVVSDAVRARSPIAIVIEKNGVGAGVPAGVRKNHPGAVIVEHWSSGTANKNNSELHIRRAEMKALIESGAVPVGGDMLYEVKHSIVTDKAAFEGPDDVLSAQSIVRGWLEKNPWIAPVEEIDRRVTYVAPTRRSGTHRH